MRGGPGTGTLSSAVDSRPSAGTTRPGIRSGTQYPNVRRPRRPLLVLLGDFGDVSVSGLTLLRTAFFMLRMVTVWRFPVGGGHQFFLYFLSRACSDDTDRRF
jgi:hypothetical protein